jgi:hypothetical protein
MDRNHEGVLCLQDFLDALQAAQRQGFCSGVDLVGAYNALAMERARGGPQGLSMGPDYGSGGQQQAPVDGSSALGMTYHEFIAAAMINRVDLTEERVAQVFHALDFEKAGFLSADGVRMALGDDLPQATVEAMLSTAHSLARGRGDVASNTLPASPAADLPPIVELQQFIDNFREAYATPPAEAALRGNQPDSTSVMEVDR